MLIGVVSDTHMPKKGKELPQKVQEGLSRVDLILHAGDITEKSIIRELEKLAPVTVVAGNMDSGEIRDKYPEKLIVEYEKVRIGVFHGHGKSGKTIDRAFKAFTNAEVDIIIFGHSHRPLLTKLHDITMFNPGSPTDPRKEPLPSYGIIKVEAGLFHCQHIYLERSR